MTLPPPPSISVSGTEAEPPSDNLVDGGGFLMSPETASALALRAACTDVETWAVSVSTADGCVGLNDLVGILDLLRDTTEGVVP